MKIIIPFLIFFISCNADSSNYKISHRPTVVDSLIKTSDSVNDALRDMKSDMAQAISFAKKIVSLKKEKETYEQPIVLADRYSDAYYLPSDEKDRKIRELTEQILNYEREISRLRKRISADSAIKYGKLKPMPDYIDQVPNEEKPNDKSLIITLNKKLRGDGDISETGVSVWIMKYTKKAKKLFKGYESCQQKDLNLLDAKEANYYQGQYFFNDVEPGEYLIKVCALYGNWMVINKKDYKQEIEILMSPPIQ